MLPNPPPRQPKRAQEKKKAVVQASSSSQAQPDASSADKSNKVDYNVLAHLKKIPALLSVHDALMLSHELRQALIEALQNPEAFQVHFAQVKEALKNQFAAMVKFTNEDLMLGTIDHKIVLSMLRARLMTKKSTEFSLIPGPRLGSLSATICKMACQ